MEGRQVRPLFWEMKMWQCHKNGKMSVHQTDTWHPFFSRATYFPRSAHSVQWLGGWMDACSWRRPGGAGVRGKCGQLEAEAAWRKILRACSAAAGFMDIGRLNFS